MLCLSLLVILLTQSIRTAHVTDKTNIYANLKAKINLLNSQKDITSQSTESLLEKLDRLNLSESESVELSEDDEFLYALESWLNAEQMKGVVKDLQRLTSVKDGNLNRIDDEYDNDWGDEDVTYLTENDYPLNDDWDTEDFVESSTSTKPSLRGIVPSAITRPVKVMKTDRNDNPELSAAMLIATTNARPRIIENPNMSPRERRELLEAVRHSTVEVFNASKCLLPQPRWLPVRQLAPAADTTYTPPCVQLHRCAVDSGCCVKEGEVCAPVEGKHVLFPFFLIKAAGSGMRPRPVKMEFYNHTRCACVPAESLHTSTSRSPGLSDSGENGQNDWRMPTEEPILDKNDQETTTAPPQLRRCTCPGLFLASMVNESPCSCVCDWPDLIRHRECQSLAKGKEHFGLRDRVCVERGDCTPPTCEYGAYNRTAGRCPLRKYRRMKFSRARYLDKTYTV